MKNKKILSARLILEGLRQTLLIGLVSIFGSIILPILTFFFTGYKFANFDEINKTETGSFFGTKYLDLFLIIMSFALFFSLFRFMNNRKRSDFYNSLGFNKNCILLSYLISIQFWMLLSAILMTTVMTVCTLVKFPNGVNIGYQFLFDFFLQFIAVNLLCCAIHTIAVSLNGTTINAVFASIVILFLPQLIMLSTTEPVKYLFGILDNDYAFNIPFIGKNIPAMSLVSKLNIRYFSSFSSYSSIDTSNIVYTVVLSVIYFILGTVLFNIRKSEIAERKGKNAFLVGAVGLTVSLPIMTSSIVTMFSQNAYSANLDGFYNIALSFLEVIIICLIIWVVLNRGFKKIGQLCLTVAAIAVINAAMFASVYLITINELSFQPTADEIEKVEIINYDIEPYGSSDYDQEKIPQFFGSDGMYYYINEITSNITSYKNKELIAENVAVKSGSLKYGSLGTVDDKTLFKITTKDGKVKYRNYCLMQYQDKIILTVEELINNELNERFDELKAKFAQLPEDDKIVTFTDNVLNEEECRAVYDLLKAEIKENPDLWAKEVVNFAENNQFDIWNGYKVERRIKVDGTPYPLLKIRAQVEGKEKIIAIPLFKSFPKSFECYFDFYNRKVPNIKNDVLAKMLETINSFDVSENNLVCDFRLNLLSEKYDGNYEFQSSTYSDGVSGIEEWYNYLLSVKDEPITHNCDVVSVKYIQSGYCSTAYFAVDEESVNNMYYFHAKTKTRQNDS